MDEDVSSGSAHSNSHAVEEPHTNGGSNSDVSHRGLGGPPNPGGHGSGSSPDGIDPQQTLVNRSHPFLFLLRSLLNELPLSSFSHEGNV